MPCPALNSSKNSFCGPNLSFFRILQSLADAFSLIDACGDVEQALVGFGILYDSRFFPPYLEHYTTVALFLGWFMERLHLVNSESHFDRTDGRDRVAIWSNRRLETPSLDSLYGFLIQT